MNPGQVTAFFTIISKNYLAAARTLAESVRKHHPGAPFFCLIVDRVDGAFDPKAEPFHVVEVEELSIPEIKRFLFHYTILELNTAAKPFFMQHLLERHRVDKLVYLDPDILVFRPLAGLLELLEHNDIVLTPHLLAPYADDKHPTELEILRAGTFNLGFIAVRAGATTTKLLDWWAKRLYSGCQMAVELGMHVDQKWIDLVPGFFDRVFISRDPGYNVAYWNLHERTVSVRGDEFFANGSPLHFFHFSGFDPRQPHKISKHQNRFAMNEVGEARRAFELYAERLLAHGYGASREWAYAFDRFDNGEKITPGVRREYLHLGEETRRFGDPFAAAGLGSFFHFSRRKSAKMTESRSARRAASNGAHPARPFGVNHTGYFQSEKGTGEGGRSILRAIEAAKIPVALDNVVDPTAANQEKVLTPFSRETPYAVNLIQVNADQLLNFVDARGPEYLGGRYNIGFWNWELATFPPEWQACFRPLAEVWVPSSYTVDALSAVSPVPVRRVPFPVSVPGTLPAGVDRRSFELPDGTFVFLFAFDFQSYLARKNPLATIEAFRRAFSDRDDVLLVVKTAHSKHAPEAWAELQAAARDRKNIRLLDIVLDRAQLYALMRLADAYVSLHRCEGYGLTIYESMAMGKPVIATAYSANMELMHAENSLPVRYRLAEIEKDHGPYRRGAVWADPDVDHAASQMRRIFEDRALAKRLGERARTDVVRELDPARVGRLIRARLAELFASGPPTSDAGVGAAPSLDRLREFQDMKSGAIEVRRPLLGGAVTAAHNAAKRLLNPVFDRQTAHNAAVAQLLSDLVERVESLEDRRSPISAPEPESSRMERIFERFYGSSDEARRRQEELRRQLGSSDVCILDGDGSLAEVADGSLRGIIVTRSLESLNESRLTVLLEIAHRKLARGGTLLIEAIHPKSWSAYSRAFSVNGRSFEVHHFEVVAFLAEQAGFDEVTSNAAPNPTISAELIMEAPLYTITARKTS